MYFTREKCFSTSSWSRYENISAAFCRYLEHLFEFIFIFHKVPLSLEVDDPEQVVGHL